MAKLVQIYVEGVSQTQLHNVVNDLQDQIDALGGNSILAPTVVDGDTTHAPTGEAVFEAIKVVQNDVDTHEARVDNPHSVTAAQIGAEQVANKGQANGYVPLNGSGQIAQQYLPSYVDDVLEFANLAAFPATGETGKIYVAIDTGRQYRWSGSAYIQITNGLIASTDNVPEGSTNFYFTVARVLASVLTGFAAAVSYSAVTASDTVLSAFGKLQKGITDLFALKMDKSANLSDLDNAGTARTNLNVKGYTITNYSTASNPADATTYYIGSLGTMTLTTAGLSTTARRKYINQNGTITSCQISIINGTVDATTETATLWCRINDTTDYLISNAIQFSAATGKVYNITGLSIPITAGDFQVSKLLTPTWVTNPANMHIEISYYVE